MGKYRRKLNFIYLIYYCFPLYKRLKLSISFKI